MQSSNDHAVLTLGDGKVETVTSATCRDFVYFRQLLRLARRPDDNINHQLNKINANNETDCNKLYEKMKQLHRERQYAIEFCKAQIKMEIDAEVDANKKKILLKEVYDFHILLIQLICSLDYYLLRLL